MPGSGCAKGPFDAPPIYSMQSKKYFVYKIRKRCGAVSATLLEAGQGAGDHLSMIKRSPFRHFKPSPEIIRLAVMLYVHFPLSLRNFEDVIHEGGVNLSHKKVRLL